MESRANKIRAVRDTASTKPQRRNSFHPICHSDATAGAVTATVCASFVVGRWSVVNVEALFQDVFRVVCGLGASSRVSCFARLNKLIMKRLCVTVEEKHIAYWYMHRDPARCQMFLDTWVGRIQ